MEFPSWDNFKQGLEILKVHVAEFKTNHRSFYDAIGYTFGFLPSPFNLIAKKIYDDLGGTEEEKIDQAIRVMNQIYQNGETHYKEMLLIIQQNTSDIQDIRALSAKESTLM